MKKELRIAVIDTETATLTGNVFDFGMVITNKKGEVLDSMEFIAQEVFHDLETMQKAFYFNKVDSFYRPNVRCGRQRVIPWAEGMKEARAMLRKWDVEVISAYNLAFDRRVIINTSREHGFGIDFRKYKLLDLWRVSCETLLQQKTFQKMARGMGWVSPAGNLRSNAEIAFRYGMGEWEFSESHTALDDALIETALLARLFGLKQTINYGLVAHPWRLIQNK